MSPHPDRPLSAAVTSSLLLFLLFPVSAVDLPLDDVELRCCTLEESPIVFKDPTKPLGFDGIALEYLSLLQEKLGFRCSSLKLYTDPISNNTGFTAFIKHMESCTVDGEIPKDDPRCRCDIGVGGWSLNEDRMGRVDFLPPFLFDNYRVLTHLDNTATSTGGAFFLTAFNSEVWVSISTLIIVFTFLKLLDRRFAPPGDDYKPPDADQPWLRRFRHFLLKSRIPYRLRRAVQSTLSKMIGQSTSDIVGDYSSTRQWVLNFAIVLCGLFLVLAYEATMTASLVQQTLESDFRNINDLKLCRIPGKDVCIPSGGAVEAFWNNAVAPKSCHNGEKGPQRYESYDAAISETYDKKCKFMIALGATVGNAENGRYCGSLVTTGAPFFGGGISHVLPKGSRLTDVMSTATLQLRNEDAIPTVNSYFTKRGLCKVTTTPSLTFKKLRVFFILAFVACLLIFLEMVIDPQTAVKKEKDGRREVRIEIPVIVDDKVAKVDADPERQE